MNTMPVATAPPSASPVRRRLDPSRWSGVLFAVLAVAAVALSWTTTPYTDSPQDYIDAYADGAELSGLGRFLALVALIAFLWAIARLRAALPTERGNVATAAIGPAGTVFAAAWLGMFAAMTAVGSAVETAEGFEDPGFEVVPETALVVDFISDAFTWALMVAAAVLVWAVALAGKRARVLPDWLSWIGIILAVLLPFGWLFFMVPVLGFLLWLAAVVAIVPAQSRSEGAS